MVTMSGEIAETGALMPGHSRPVALGRLSSVVHSTTIKHTADNKQNRTVPRLFEQLLIVS